MEKKNSVKNTIFSCKKISVK